MLGEKKKKATDMKSPPTKFRQCTIIPSSQAFSQILQRAGRHPTLRERAQQQQSYRASQKLIISMFIQTLKVGL